MWCSQAMKADLTELRRENMRRLGRDAKTLSEQTGKSFSYWRDVLGSGEKSFGEKAARATEAKLDLPHGWLDTANSPKSTPPNARPTLPDALQVVLDELHGLSPSRWAAARAMLDQLVTRPDLRAEAEAELLHLLSTPPAKRQGSP